MLSFEDSHCREQFFPLTLTRHTADLRAGIFTIREKWSLAMERFPGIGQLRNIPADIIPGSDFFSAASADGLEAAMANSFLYKTVRYPWDILAVNGWSLQEDLLLAQLLPVTSIPPGIHLTGPAGSLFIEDGASLGHCYLNTVQGPVHIAAGAEIMDGAMIRGPVSIGKGAVVKMGATIYGATTIGPGSVIGGEIKNSIFHGHSNKAHHGYIGDAYIGAWCNLGAGSSCSNLRNNASPVKVWSMQKGSFLDAGLKCGLIMGDYSRCSINASFNTGAVVGVCANIFQSGTLLPKYIPSFSWGAETGVRYEWAKMIRDIEQWMALKGCSLSTEQIDQLQQLYSNN